MKRSSKADALLEALPYFQQFRGRTVVVKYGGAAMENPDLVESVMHDIVFLEAVGINPVVVHGGGKAITAAMRQENLTARFVDGFRHTDEPSMKIIDRILTEVISPSLAGKIVELGGKAEVLSGKEVLVAAKAPLHTDATGAQVDLGLIGDVTDVRIEKIQKLVDSEIVPVISPVGKGVDGQLYNINADIAAAKIAQALKAHKIIYLSDVNGVRRDPKDEASLISTLTPAQIESLKEQGVIAGGMIPKINSALEALAGGVAKVHFLDGKQVHSLLLELFTDAGIGTEIAAHRDKP
ncbi:MAG TPA: acetylglutamate kinase [Candidatus Methylacidiphilales bacterium]|jgi:acetylglutamate kinase|nr:acetylglutamate kinase [Candidatus Methylacidiphilales bacterium]